MDIFDYGCTGKCKIWEHYIFVKGLLDFHESMNILAHTTKTPPNLTSIYKSNFHHFTLDFSNILKQPAQ